MDESPPLAPETRPPLPRPRPKPDTFARSLANVLVSEGGNDDDPRDPGGRTSRGIIAREWAKWRKTHPGLPADVWHAPQDQIEAIYRENYWDAMRCEELPAGLDYSVFDLAVNSGVERAGKMLRRALGLSENDWHVTDAVLRAARAAPATTLIIELNDRRLRFLKGLHTWPTFGRGWAARVASVKRISLRMADPVVSLIDIPDEPAFGPGKAYR